MKKFLLSCSVLFATVSSQAAVGDDLTANYLQNADFSQGEVVDNGICTYDYDMAKNETTYFGQQDVAGWLSLNPTDNTLQDGRTDGANARAAGLFAISDPDEATAYLGGVGFKAPIENSVGDGSGNALGLLAVWGASLQYTQTVTLPAGAYTITVSTYNAGGTGAIAKNLFGFITEDGKAYTSATTTWGEVGVWADQVVTFLLETETTGVISVGYAAGNGGSGSMPHLFIDNVLIEEADPLPIIQAQVDALKEDLLPLLEAGDELGVNTKDGWSVYNNDNATLEEVQQAIDRQKDLNEKGMTDLTDFFINNAHFSEGTPLDGGVCTYDYDMPNNSSKYYGMQAIEKWTASSPSDNVQKMENSGSTPTNPLNSRASGLFAVGSGDEVWLGSVQDKVPATKANGSTEGNVFGFISVWSGTAYYTQHVTLPAGNYTITIPTYNERGTGSIGKNLCGFIADDGSEYLAGTKTFKVGTWSNETIKFSLDDETPGVISIGYTASNAGSGSMPHLFVDEFELKYNGLLDVTPSLLALQGAVRTAEGYTDGNILYEASIMNRLEQAVAEGHSLINAGSSDDDANVAAATVINNIIIEAKASVAVYEQFEAFIEGTLSQTVEKYAEGELSSFSEELADLRDTYYDAYGDGSYTSEQIQEIISGLKSKVTEAVQEALATASVDGADHNLDVSVLFENLDFANRSTTGWTATFTSGKFESQQNGVLEVWSPSSVDFTASTTLANLPAGAYEISAPAWYRDAGDVAEGYTHYMNNEPVGGAYIFANGNKTLLLNQGAEVLVSAEQDDIHNGAALEGEAYVPNGQGAAQTVFYSSDIDVTNTVTTALTEAGDLTIGFKGVGLESGTWTVWGAMKVVYKGTDKEMILAAKDNEIADLVSQAEQMSEDAIVASVEQALANLEQAIKAGEAAQNVESVEEKIAAIETLKAALQYGSESEPLILKLMDVFNLYGILLSDTEVESDDDTLADLLDEEISDPEEGAPSNEKIAEWIEAIPVAWVKFVLGQSEMSKASEKNPVDVTPVILNAGFEGALGDNSGAEYWSVTRNGGNEGYEYGIYEFFNNNSFDINQTVNNLVPGYYRVMVQSFYRAGSNADNVTSYTENPDSIQYVSLYANDDTVKVKNVLALEAVEESGYEPGMAFGAEGEVTVSYNDNEEFYIPNNRFSLQYYFEAGCYWNQIDCLVAEDGVLKLGLCKDGHIGNDWCPYDNFQLYYLGAVAPTALESIATDKAANSTIYDLTGRKVSKAQKGLYIKAGKVVLVK